MLKRFDDEVIQQTRYPTTMLNFKLNYFIRFYVKVIEVFVKQFTLPRDFFVVMKYAIFRIYPF